MLEKQQENFVTAVSGHQCKEKVSGNEKKVNENTYDISSIKKYLEVSGCSRAKQRQRNVPKSSFLLIRPIVVLHCLRRLALHDFIFCLNKL